jgi:hypothetical protein
MQADVLPAQPAWADQPLPSTPPWGPIEHATGLLIARCALRWPDAQQLLPPLLGLDGSDQLPPSKEQVSIRHGVSANRLPYLLSMITPLARHVGAPDSLRRAVQDAADEPVIQARRLSARWHHDGHTRGQIHPEAARRIAHLFGLSPTWTVRSDSRWPDDVVVRTDLGDALRDTFRRVRHELRDRRLVPTATIAELMPSWPTDHAAELLDAFGWLSADGTHAVDNRPWGLDHGIGRGLAAAAGRPLTLPQLQEALRRWTMEASRPDLRWAAHQLETYLQASPLYEAVGNGAHKRWIGVGEWPKLTPADEQTVGALHPIGPAATWTQLTTALQAAGLSRNAAHHRILTSRRSSPTGAADTAYRTVPDTRSCSVHYPPCRATTAGFGTCPNSSLLAHPAHGCRGRRHGATRPSGDGFRQVVRPPPVVTDVGPTHLCAGR